MRKLTAELKVMRVCETCLTVINHWGQSAISIPSWKINNLLDGESLSWINWCQSNFQVYVNTNCCQFCIVNYDRCGNFLVVYACLSFNQVAKFGPIKILLFHFTTCQSYLPETSCFNSFEHQKKNQLKPPNWAAFVCTFKATTVGRVH